MELHTSFRVDESQRYYLRGLSVYPTRMKRFLEWVRLDYDPKSPVPVETHLNQKIGFEWATQRRLSLSFCLGKKNDDVVLVRVDFLQLF